jgi:WhiB family redox-sensing transcriptional regulator
MNEQNWRYFAACRGEDPELFQPISETGPALLQIAEAKAVCAHCPVAEQCLQEALAGGEVGVWGGTTEDERRVILRRRAAPVAS